MTLDPTSPDRNCADTLIVTGHPEEAIAIYRRLVEKFPTEESHLLALAWALYDIGRFGEAAGCFERLFEKELERKIFTGFAYDELVRIYRAEENWDALITVCQRAAAAQPDDTGLLRTLGEAFLGAGKAGSASGVFEKLTLLEPDAPENWCALGISRLAMGDPDRAEEAYVRAAQIEPEDAPLFFARLADGCIRAGYPERAREVREKGLALDPHQAPQWMALAETLICLGNPDAAAEACTRAAALRPEITGDCWYRLGNLLAKGGLLSQATEAFTKAVLTEPENPRYLLQLAASFAARGLEAPASEALHRASPLIVGKSASTGT